VDASGNSVTEYAYDAWGKVVSSTGPMASINPIKYRGYYYDTETGYYFLQTRYYSPQWRRFINADALFVAGNPLTGSNMYAYCDGNPVMLVDQTGMDPVYMDFANSFGSILDWLRTAASMAADFYLYANSWDFSNLRLIWDTIVTGINYLNNTIYNVLIGMFAFESNNATWGLLFAMGTVGDLAGYLNDLKNSSFLKTIIAGGIGLVGSIFGASGLGGVVKGLFTIIASLPTKLVASGIENAISGLVDRARDILVFIPLWLGIIMKPTN